MRFFETATAAALPFLMSMGQIIQGSSNVESVLDSMLCYEESGEFHELNDVPTYKNDVMLLAEHGEEKLGSTPLSIHGETIKFHGSETAYRDGKVNVGWLIEPEDNIDIVLSFVELEHRSYIMWRETYTNEMFRFGLITIHDGLLVLVCEGEKDPQSAIDR